MPFDDDGFDVVLSASALHYFPKPRAVAAESSAYFAPPDGSTCWSGAATRV